MAKRSRGGSRQAFLLPRSRRSIIEVEASHPMVSLTDSLDWTALIEYVPAFKIQPQVADSGVGVWNRQASVHGRVYLGQQAGYRPGIVDPGNGPQEFFN